MNMIYNRIKAVFYVCASLLIIGCADKKSRDSIRIAVNLPLTGPVAAFSGGFPAGLKLGVEDTCRKLHLSDDIFKYDFADNKANPMDAVTALNKQMINGFDIYFSGTTESALAVLPKIDICKDVVSFIVAFDTYMTERGQNRVRYLPNFKNEALLWERFVEKNMAKKVMAITLDMAGTQEQFETLIFPKLVQQGIAYKNEKFPYAEKDFRSIIMKAKEYSPDVILVNGYSFHLQTLVELLHEYGLTSSAKIMMSMDFADLIGDTAFLRKAEQIYFSCPRFNMPDQKKKNSEWCDWFRKKTGKDPGYMEAYAYDTGVLIVKCYERFGRISIEELRKSVPFEGVTGNVAFDDKNDTAASVVLAQIYNGTVQMSE